MDTKTLEKAGLTGNEIKIYLALLKLGSVTAGEIIKKTKLHRAGVYDTLERLIEKGLVSYVIRANRKYFEAMKPDRLIDFVEKKENELEKEKRRLKQLIPELNAMRLLSKEAQEVTLFKGNKGIQSVLQHMINVKEVLAFGGYSEDTEGFQHCLKYILPRYHKQRIKYKTRFKFIFTEAGRKRTEELKKMPYTKVRMLKEKFAPMTGIYVFDESVAIILWSKNPMAILIRSKEIMNSYKQYFESLWKRAQSL